MVDAPPVDFAEVCREYVHDLLEDAFEQLPMLEVTNEFKRGILANIVRIAIRAGISTDEFTTQLRSLGIAPSREHTEEALYLKQVKERAWNHYRDLILRLGYDSPVVRLNRDTFRRIEQECIQFAALHPLEWSLL